MKKIIGFTFVLLGILLISYPLYQEWTQKKDVKALEEAFALIKESDGGELDLTVIDHLPFSKEEIDHMLELEIPSINLKQFVLDETTDENLKIALTQIKREQTPGVGNFTIAGHRGYRDGRHFRHLAEVPIGEKVFLHADDTTYIYEVIGTDVIKATDVEVLNDTPGKNEITLITCTATGIERVAVKGLLQDTVKN
ncbi:class D sortase [Bacillus sp. FJAT-50079]|uniref:class D sortase n=1 Tax=Bacillus sp. FJAT-50079 TaxID=2833577 RepID=UPI001BC9C860|nr:class D sortase [Bacillus sp. FJAT-50079]